ncbi:hypothetical protein PAHAL_4G130400 [Panicum hallii]|uniref:Uncharacterized protein n=1 Tax=Panicum hallii TaxID=206008 RepID=A0A2S3HIY6_9POAL|nr:hypothetical protein PAHAL_4G130400 [Panicum hallii]
MSCQKLSRQSLHLVLNEGRGLYSLRHMDVSKLFYPSAAEALEAKAKAKMKKNGTEKIGSLSCLLEPSIHYQPYTPAVSNPYSSISALALFGENKNKILCSDVAGNARLYNTELHSLIAIPKLNSPKEPNSVAVSIPDATTNGRSDFGNHRQTVLSYDPVGSWCWDPLPQPPFLKEPACEAPLQAHFTVVDSIKICVATTKATYCFDTVTREWNKPVVQHIGMEFELPDNWWQVTCNLVNLGSQRFCIASSFMVDNDQDEYDSVTVTVLTGVEVVAQ